MYVCIQTKILSSQLTNVYEKYEANIIFSIKKTLFIKEYVTANNLHKMTAF